MHRFYVYGNTSLQIRASTANHTSQIVFFDQIRAAHDLNLQLSF